MGVCNLERLHKVSMHTFVYYVSPASLWHACVYSHTHTMICEVVSMDFYILEIVFNSY